MPELTAAQWYVAMLKGECPIMVWHKSKEATENAANCPGGCKGTSQVYLLPDAVRVPCSCCQHPADPCECKLCLDSDTCVPCHGLGWRPDDRLEVWLDGLAKARWAWRIAWNHHVRLWYSNGPVTNYFSHREEATTFETLIEGLVEALTPLTVNADEARKWVQANTGAE